MSAIAPAQVARRWSPAALLSRGLASPFARDVGQTFGARVAATALGAGTAVIGARLLGPSGWGVYAAALAVTNLVGQFGNLGLQSANTYHVSRDRSLAAGLAANSLAVSAVGAVTAGILFAGAWLRPALFPVTGAVLALALTGVPLLLAGIFLRALLLGVGRVAAYNVAEVLSPATMLAGVAALGLAGAASPARVVAVAVFGIGVGAVYSAVALRGVLPRVVGPSRTLFRLTLGFGTRAYIANVFGYALLRIDLLMVKMIGGAAQAGDYAVATSLADALYLLPTVVGAVLLPRLVSLPSRERWRFSRTLTWQIAGFCALSGLIAAAVARPVLVLLFGGAFVGAVPAFRVLTGAMVFYGANNIVSKHLAAGGFPLLAVWIWGVAAAANVALNLVLIPRYGPLGAAVASLVCYALVLAVQYGYAQLTVEADAREA